MNTVICRTIDLPTAVRGMTLPDENGDFNVYINARIGYVEQQKAAAHELRHIARGDWSREDVGQIEAEAHGKVERWPEP